MPENQFIAEFREPIITANILVTDEFVGNVISFNIGSGNNLDANTSLNSDIKHLSWYQLFHFLGKPFDIFLDLLWHFLLYLQRNL
jgi:translation elongation factor EF-4